VVDWKAVVIYPSKEAESAGNRAWYQEFFESGRLIRIYLKDLPAFDELSSELKLLKLIVMPDEQVAVAAKEWIPLATVEEIDFIEQIFVLKFSTLTREKVRTMLGLKEELFKDTQFYKDVIKEGKLEGKLEGELEGKLKAVPLLRRLGQSDEAIATELELPIDQVRLTK
jgi:predicted transposase/invertase (TIGR01784 family)